MMHDFVFMSLQSNPKIASLHWQERSENYKISDTVWKIK